MFFYLFVFAALRIAAEGDGDEWVHKKHAHCFSVSVYVGKMLIESWQENSAAFMQFLNFLLTSELARIEYSSLSECTWCFACLEISLWNLKSASMLLIHAMLLQWLGTKHLVAWSLIDNYWNLSRFSWNQVLSRDWTWEICMISNWMERLIWNRVVPNWVQRRQRQCTKHQSVNFY